MDLDGVCVVDIVGVLWVLFYSWYLSPLPCWFLEVKGSLPNLHLRMSGVGRNETIPGASETPSLLSDFWSEATATQARLPWLGQGVPVFLKLPLSGKIRLQICRPEILCKSSPVCFLTLNPSYFLSQQHHYLCLYQGVKMSPFNTVSEVEKPSEVGMCGAGVFHMVWCLLVSDLNICSRERYQ